MTKKKLVLLSLALTSQIHAQEISVSATNDSSYVISGGVDEASVSRNLVVVTGEYNFNDIFTGYVEGQLQRGDNGGDDTGDLQIYSNIDEDDFSQVYEVWVEANFSSQNLRVKLGKVDANNEFAFVDHGSEFINSSMGFSPTISFFPTYPNPTLSANVFWGFSDTSTLSTAIYSDKSDEFEELFYISQWTSHHKAFLLKVGVWHQTGKIERLDTAEFNDGATGYYVASEGSLAWPLFSASSAGWFSQLGISDDTVSEIDFHFGAGLIWYDTFGQEGDSNGIAFTHVKTSSFLNSTLPSKETAFEVFYKYQLNEYIALKPDLQIIVSPAAVFEASDAVVLTLRSEFSF